MFAPFKLYLRGHLPPYSGELIPIDAFDTHRRGRHTLFVQTSSVRCHIF